VIDSVPIWYHTLELPQGVTPGWFDLRPVLERLPWPEVAGRRCLDVGTYDGFYAFELERRGAAEVVATDIPAHAGWDLAPAGRERTGAALAQASGEKGRGFALAREALGSAVQRELVSVYDLDPEEHGEFDVVVCGSLLLHLQDPVRALEAIRGVCRGVLLSVEEVSLPLSLLARRRPLADMRFSATPTQWWVTNAAGHRRLLECAGFGVLRSSGLYCEPYGRGHSPRGRGLRPALTSLARRTLAGGDGVPHHALLARPA
jgi:tRNA (mo5U34)-methyltransferase